MKNVPLALAVLLTVAALPATPLKAGQFVSPDPTITPGVKYSPAPGQGGSEFQHSYWAVDAQTGQMSKISASDHPVVPDGYDTNQQEEEVLFVAPNVSVENRYVPYPGAGRQTPPPPPAYPQQSGVGIPPPSVIHQQPARTAQPPRPFRNETTHQAPPPAFASEPSPLFMPPPPSAPRHQETVRRPDPAPAFEPEATASAMPVNRHSPEVKKAQDSFKKSSGRKISKSRSEKQPWWRHIWRN